MEETVPLDMQVQRQIVQQGDALASMLKSEGWSVYKKILQAQIDSRLSLILSPLHSLSSPDLPQEFMAKATALESIKGAKIGLQLALDIPTLTMDHAAKIRKSWQQKGDSDD